MTKINYFHESMPKNQRFIALHADGGGASLFIENNGCCYDSDGMSYVLEDLPEHGYNAWIALPDDYKFWFELKGK